MRAREAIEHSVRQSYSFPRQEAFSPMSVCPSLRGPGLKSHFIFQVSEMCCEAVKKLFKQDKLGQASLGVIKVISGFVKGRNYEVRPEVSLLSLLCSFFVLNYSQLLM